MTRELEASCHKGNTLAEDYQILGTLGKGSFAEVKVAVHLMTQTIVAIKILKRDTNTDFLVSSEIDFAKSQYHSNIIKIFQIIETRHKTYLVMEYASRGSLHKYIRKCRHLDEEEARNIFRELSLAINYIHSQNIAHRDIKAENIVLDCEGHIKLIDFGFAKRLASGEKFKGFCGTPQYCAPEVFGDTEYDILPTDIWSLGVVLYYLVVGHLPFTETVLSMMKDENLPWSCRIPYRLSSELQHLLKRIMTIDPSERPSIKEILAHPWLRHDPDTLIPSEEIPREPEPDIAFAMFLLGYNIQELRDALREKKYSPAMATYLIIKQKFTCQPQVYHDGGQGGTLDPTEGPNLPWPLRRVGSAPSLPTFTLYTLSELPGDGRKGLKRRHSVPPSLSSLKSSFLENVSSLQGLMPHIGKGTFRKKKSSISFTTPSSRIGKAATITTLTTVTRTTSGPSCSLLTSLQTPTFENMQDVANESSEAQDMSRSVSSWRSTTMSPFPSVKVQEENIGTESLQDSSSSSWETDHQEQLQRQSQGVPRVPLRRWGWKGLKKRIAKALRSLCCCLPVTNNKIVPANEECFRDTGKTK
ncbi:sperm motility kinase 4A-like isoform X2 [Mastomys coucha]|uniref:sperm motility kinase 4A-like isoform X2 n=1 Tax=Mastomys coucha TaxID=35658 RepID=UPI0012614D1B|nr:sperm motility kinase 4A-like isoform X2 [Mastomys coucha]